MAYICQSCNKFCSLEAGEEPETDTEEIEDDGSIRLSFHVSYTSGCCGDEVAEANYDPESTVEIEHKEGCEGPLRLEVQSVEPTDRFQEKDRHGKPIKSMRYMRHYYGVEATVVVTCDGCDASTEATLSDEAGPPEPMY